MIEYPKIETLYDRDAKTFKVMPDRLRLPEFGNIKQWHITEKVDGTNVRIGYKLGGPVEIGGRTAAAQMPTNLVNVLRLCFPPELMAKVFETAGEAEVVLFCEGYGGNIQKAGRGYRPDPWVRLFDVRVGEWWLEPDAVSDVAAKLGMCTVPYLGTIGALPGSFSDLVGMAGLESRVIEGGTGVHSEGIVARTAPLLFTRKGDRLMWKLKYKDF